MKLWLLKIRWLYKYWNFYSKAQTIYDVHAPRAFGFAREVVEDRRMFYAFFRIRALRKKLLGRTETIAIKDYGAGSKVNNSASRSIGELTRFNAVSELEGQTLFRMVQYFEPQLILELGTSLAISTLYLKLGARQIPLITVEASPETASLALKNLDQLQAGNFELWQCTFEEALKRLLFSGLQPDFVYLDGDHRGEATLNYLKQLLELCDTRPVIVIADIYWSDDMEQAWNEVCGLEDIRLSIDLFHFGVLVTDPDIISKQHYRLVPARYKPWRTGLGWFF